LPAGSFTDIYDNSKPFISFEFFPPKSPELLDDIKSVIRRMADLGPELMTVTYGAGGGTRELTRNLTGYISSNLSCPAVAHLTCVGHTKEEIRSVLSNLFESGVRHILALRGDPPKGIDKFTPEQGGFSCARDLVKYIKEDGRFSIAVAGYPEVHPDATSSEADQEYLGQKIAAGGEVVYTQLFFQSALYFEYVKSLNGKQVYVPVIPGIMPISNVNQLKRFTTMCGATIPPLVMRNLEEIQGDPVAVKSYGIDLATTLCSELIKGGAPGIHFYTLNKNDQVESVVKNLKSQGLI
jgi:methylenetetrahydrofolate reductase (NADPH)